MTERVKPGKHAPPWLNIEFRLLISKRDASNRRYSRTGLRQLLDELINLANTCEGGRCAPSPPKPITQNKYSIFMNKKYLFNMPKKKLTFI